MEGSAHKKTPAKNNNDDSTPIHTGCIFLVSDAVCILVGRYFVCNFRQLPAAVPYDMYLPPVQKIQNVVAGDQEEGKVLSPHELLETDPDFDVEAWEDLSHSDQMLVSQILQTTGGTYIVYIHVYLFKLCVCVCVYVCVHIYDIYMYIHIRA